MEHKEPEPEQKGGGDPRGISLENLDREVTFYYNRERRLERASPAVRALNEGLPVKRGFIRSLTSTKPHQFLFVSILIVMAMLMAFSALSGVSRNSLTMAGNALRISAGRSGDGSFIIINKNIAAGEENPYIGEVYVAVSPVLRSSQKREGADIPVFTSRIFFTMEQEEEYRLVLPFNGERYMLLFRVGNQQASVRIKAD
jgi:hypothetical protein